MRPNGLPQRVRLHLKRDFECIIQSGTKYQTPGLVMWCRCTPHSQAVRFAVVVSKKLGPAVVRNRTKRMLREIFRTNKTCLLPGADLIFSPRDAKTFCNASAAQDALMNLWKTAALLKPFPQGKKRI